MDYAHTKFLQECGKPASLGELYIIVTVHLFATRLLLGHLLASGNGLSGDMRLLPMYIGTHREPYT